MPRNVKQILNHLAEKKRDAYVDYFTNYVVGKDENTAMLGITDADDLYDYFLTDVKTSADFETSYVSDALASIQQYISNILNQKEPGYSGEFSEELQQWWSGYLGHISLWKAYQKMEDYPEDYNLPDHVTEKQICTLTLHQTLAVTVLMMPLYKRLSLNICGVMKQLMRSVSFPDMLIIRESEMIRIHSKGMVF